VKFREHLIDLRYVQPFDYSTCIEALVSHGARVHPVTAKGFHKDGRRILRYCEEQGLWVSSNGVGEPNISIRGFNP